MSIFNLLPYYLELRGATPSFYGQVAGTMGISNVIALLLLGHQADRLSRKRMISLYFISAFAGNLLALWALGQPSMLWYVAVRLLHGVFAGLGIPLVFSWVVDFSPPARKQVTVAWFGIAGLLANALGPFIGELLLAAHPRPNDPSSYGVIFWLATAFEVAGFVCWLMTTDSHPAKRYGAHSQPQGGMLGMLRKRHTLLMTLTTLSFGGMLGVLLSFGKNYVSALGLRYVSVLLWANMLGAVGSRVFIQQIAALIPQKHLAPSALALMGLAFLLLSQSKGYGLLSVSGMIYGLSYGVLYAVVFATFLEAQPPSQSGQAATLFQGSFSAGWGGFPFIGGMLVRFWGFAVLFQLLGLLAFVCVYLTYRSQTLAEEERLRKAKV